MLIAALVAIPAAAGDAAKQAKDKLKGAWQSTKIVNAGKKVDRQGRVEFDGDQVKMTPMGKGTMVGKYAIDPSKSPATMDITIDKEGVMLMIPAIYELKGDELRICHAQGEGGVRPTAFEATEKTALATLKRDK